MALQKGGSMVLKIVIALVAIVVAFAAFVALQPSEYRIARSATIAAPASDGCTSRNVAGSRHGCCARRHLQNPQVLVGVAGDQLRVSHPSRRLVCVGRRCDDATGRAAARRY